MILYPAHQKQSVYTYRLHYTDSGHYLLPTDDPASQIREEANLAATGIDALKQTICHLNKLLPQGERSVLPRSSSEIDARDATRSPPHAARIIPDVPSGLLVGEDTATKGCVKQDRAGVAPLDEILLGSIQPQVKKDIPQVEPELHSSECELAS